MPEGQPAATSPQPAAPSLSPASTLAQRIQLAAEHGGSLTFVGSASGPETVPWARLHADARAVAGRLQARGVAPGDHVALLGPTSPGLVTAIQATWLAGAASVVLPLPMRLGSLEAFVEQTRARIGACDAAMVVADPDLAPFIDQAEPPVVLLTDLGSGSPGESVFEEPDIDPDSLAILQFTSGSTAHPKGVMLPHAQVVANLDAIVAKAGLDPATDRGASWLPLYHDMGLIGLLGVPMCTGMDLVLAAPQDFLGAPARWLEWIATFEATVSAGPNFAYALAARGLTRQQPLDLSRWRLALNGAEPIDPDAVDAFTAAGSRHGLDPLAACCVYGMAEATLAITFPEPGTGMGVDWVDRRVLENEGCAAPLHPGEPRAKRLAVLGTPLQGLELRVVDPDTGTVRTAREVGEIEIRGTPVTPGYYRDPAATVAAFHDGWLRTGDLGYAIGEELVVCGRAKDMIIVGGRNVFPEDIERAAASVPGVRAGNVIAFGVAGRKGREAVVVVAETRDGDDAGLPQAVADEVRAVVGLSLEDLVLVEPGSLPKTSSGKLQRSLCRNRYLSADLQPA